MKNITTLRAGFAFLLISTGASAGSVSFDTSNYNFPLDGGGGGLNATLNGVSVQTFCDDFANEISTNGNYTANVTTLGTSVDLSATRFGGVSSTGWAPISLNTGNTSNDSQADTFFNTGSGSSALARYEMAAYLVSLYNPALGNGGYNNQIQQAIWTEMDPSAGSALINPSGDNASSDLEKAANWYYTMNTPANSATLNSFLARYQIVDDSNMTFSKGLGVGGFQEQIVTTPEPRAGIWLLLGLLATAFFVTERRKRNVVRQKA